MADFAVLVVSEPDEPLARLLIDELFNRTGALAVSGEKIIAVRQGGQSAIDEKCRCGAVVFCRGARTAEEDNAIAWSVERRVSVIPAVPELARFRQLAPPLLASFNGFALKDAGDVSELAGLLLEILGLQSAKRKIFISYAQQDSTYIAQQLHDALIARWYRVFLDAVSIRPGAVFQEELKQELADSDVMLLLNSPSVPTRPYVQEEIVFATQAGVGGVQLVWPGRSPIREAGFFMPIDLAQPGMSVITTREAPDGPLTQPMVDRLEPFGLDKILREIATQRTVIQAYRENQVVRHVDAHTAAHDWHAFLHSGRYISLRHEDGRRVYLDLALGVPTSNAMHNALIAIRSPASCDGGTRVLYDRFGITDRQAEHVAFLSERLKFDLLDYRQADQWSMKLP